MRRPWPTGGCRAKNKQTIQNFFDIEHERKSKNVFASCANYQAVATDVQCT